MGLVKHWMKDLSLQEYTRYGKENCPFIYQEYEELHE